MINEDHSHQIQQEQDRDFKRAQVELNYRLQNIWDVADDLSFYHGEIIREDVAEIRNLIKMLGVNI